MSEQNGTMETVEEEIMEGAAGPASFTLDNDKATAIRELDVALASLDAKRVVHDRLRGHLLGQPLDRC